MGFRDTGRMSGGKGEVEESAPPPGQVRVSVWVSGMFRLIRRI